jgi:hypothetical protein
VFNCCMKIRRAMNDVLNNDEDMAMMALSQGMALGLRKASKAAQRPACCAVRSTTCLVSHVLDT